MAYFKASFFLKFEILKHADITPLYKKAKKDIKENYRPVSIPPDLSKNIWKMHVWKNVTFFQEYIFETSIWVSEGFQYPAMSSSNARKMEKVYR